LRRQVVLTNRKGVSVSASIKLAAHVFQLVVSSIRRILLGGDSPYESKKKEVKSYGRSRKAAVATVISMFAAHSVGSKGMESLATNRVILQ